MDKQYFTTELPSQYAILGQATVTVYLHIGAVFAVERLIAALDQYVILSVYHTPNTDEESIARLHPVRNEIVYDQVSVPYHSIAYVHATRKVPSTATARQSLGFHP
jgi:hypothetical protein